MNFHSYLQCQSCKHIFLQSNNRTSGSISNKFTIRCMQKREEIIQSSLTQSYFDRTSKINEARLRSVKPFLARKKKILDANASDGSMIRLLEEQGFEATGLSSQTEFASYWGDKIQNKSLCDLSEKYDAILMFDFLESAFCPYSEVLEAYLALKPGGLVLAEVSVNNDPKALYGAKTHEFSSQSLKCFAKNCDLSNLILENGGLSLLVLHECRSGGS